MNVLLMVIADPVKFVDGVFVSNKQQLLLQPLIAKQPVALIAKLVMQMENV
jgi:hypothetical protein